MWLYECICVSTKQPLTQSTKGKVSFSASTEQPNNGTVPMETSTLAWCTSNPPPLYTSGLERASYLSWVSLTVSSLRLKSSRSSPREKWRSTFCSSSTTQLLRAFLWACLCRIFSSIVPVCQHTDTHQTQTSSNTSFKVKQQGHLVLMFQQVFQRMCEWCWGRVFC